MNGQSKAIEKDVKEHLQILGINLNDSEYNNLIHSLAGELLNRITVEDARRIVKNQVVYQIENQLEDPKADHRNLDSILQYLNEI